MLTVDKIVVIVVVIVVVKPPDDVVGRQRRKSGDATRNLIKRRNGMKGKRRRTGNDRSEVDFYRFETATSNVAICNGREKVKGNERKRKAGNDWVMFYLDMGGGCQQKN